MNSLEMPENCPKCGAELLRENEGLVQFVCGSMKKARYMGLKIETAICTGRQRDQLVDRVKELEEALRKVQFYGATGCLQDSLDEAKRIAEEALKAKGAQ